MAASNVLIVDSDKGFATILSEGLNNHPEFKATAVSTSTRALQYVVEKPVDLIIVDMGIADMPPLKLVKAIREAKADMSVMIIPLIGQDVPDEVKGLGIQGVLPKSFFMGDLPKLVDQAVVLDLESETPDLPPARAKAGATGTSPRSRPKPTPARPPRRATPARPQRQPDREPARAAPRPKPAVRTRAATLPTLPSWKLEQLHKHKDDIVQQLQTLNGEIRAEVILLTAGTELIAKAGTMADSRAHELAVLVAEGAEAVSQAAAFLGERDARFEQSLHEGSEFRLYSYSLGQGVVLSLALGTNVPLGILRHQTKQTSRRLMKYIQ